MSGKVSALAVRLFLVGFSVFILVCGRSASAFLLTDLGIVSSIVLGGERIVWAIFLKVVVSVQMVHVLLRG